MGCIDVSYLVTYKHYQALSDYKRRTHNAIIVAWHRFDTQLAGCFENTAKARGMSRTYDQRRGVRKCVEAPPKQLEFPRTHVGESKLNTHFSCNYYLPLGRSICCTGKCTKPYPHTHLYSRGHGIMPALPFRRKNAGNGSKPALRY